MKIVVTMTEYDKERKKESFNLLMSYKSQQHDSHDSFAFSVAIVYSKELQVDRNVEIVLRQLAPDYQYSAAGQLFSSRQSSISPPCSWRRRIVA